MIGASDSGATGTRRRKFGRYLGAAAASVTLLVAAAIPAAAAELMTVTFVRHAQSAGNASGLIDTSVPGPHITELGQTQAQAVADKLGNNNYDAIYASTMIRTQETAAPMSEYLNLPVTVLPGIQEIEAGKYEGTPESQASTGYAVAPIKWLQGNLTPSIDGTSDTVNGTQFNARMAAALQTIYDNGDRNAVVFSHGGAIMFWTLMNAKNLTLVQKFTILQTAALKNTDYVVIEGNPEDGWTLVNWNGKLYSTEPTLEAQVALQVRTLTRQLAASAQQVVDALKTQDITKVIAAVQQGVSDAAYSFVKFGRNVGPKITTAITAAVEDLKAQIISKLPTTSASSAASTTPVSAAAIRAAAADTSSAAAETGSATKATSAKSEARSAGATSGASDDTAGAGTGGSTSKSTGGSARHRDAA
ncbi:histidine phosphatase family protein [Mycobacterium sp. M26]|uniref:histidine phosphatase family protein n=1 Tax=Mycobacterium sp. M26 TaxID=1762962 RepID=UPI000B2A488A|nr:histidine phosphatase family protein [Mycobacterium sp. M26]